MCFCWGGGGGQGSLAAALSRWGAAPLDCLDCEQRCKGK